MPLLTARNSKTMGVRLPLDVVELIENFATEANLTISGALRILIELGLDVEADIDQLRMVQYNANATALQRLDKMLGVVVENFQKDI